MTVVPSTTLRVVRDELPLEHACIMEPLGIAVRAVIEADARCGVLVVAGCGPIGLFAIGAAKALGAVRVLASDVSEVRLDLARRVGADYVIDARREVLANAVRAANEGELADCAIDTSGNPEAIGQALAALAAGGRLVMLGLPEEPVSIDLARDVILREVSVRGLYGRLIDETWLQVERLLRAGRLSVDPVMTHTFALEQHAEAFELASKGAAGKVLFAP